MYTIWLGDKLKVIAAIAAILSAALPQRSPAADLDALPAVSDARLPELSGLAVSRREPGRWWALNDSGNAPALLALDDRGQVRDEVQILGEINHDWEDLASFEDEAGRWLLIGDIGDNFGLRSEIRLILVPEPAPGAREVRPARTMRLRWPDGARDSESLAVDVAARQVLLADKGRRPAGLYAAPLDDPGPVTVLQRVADFPPLAPGPVPKALSVAAQRWRGTPTAMDLSADGSRLLVLTLEGVSCFDRAPGQDWPSALAAPAAHWVRLTRAAEGPFEAAAFDAGGRSALIGNEGRSIRFRRWTLD